MDYFFDCSYLSNSLPKTIPVTSDADNRDTKTVSRNSIDSNMFVPMSGLINDTKKLPVSLIANRFVQNATVQHVDESILAFNILECSVVQCHPNFTPYRVGHKKGIVLG